MIFFSDLVINDQKGRKDIDNKFMCSLCSLHIDTDFHIHVPGSCKDSSDHSQIV